MFCGLCNWASSTRRFSARVSASAIRLLTRSMCACSEMINVWAPAIAKSTTTTPTTPAIKPIRRRSGAVRSTSRSRDRSPSRVDSCGARSVAARRPSAATLALVMTVPRFEVGHFQRADCAHVPPRLVSFHRDEQAEPSTWHRKRKEGSSGRYNRQTRHHA